MAYSPPQPQRAFIVLNPVAGTLSTQAIRDIIEQHFSLNHWTFELHQTKADDNIADMVHQALQQDFSLVVAAGGDGTVSSVADAMVHSKIPLGILPVGTTNTLAQELNIPVNLEAACALLTGEHTVMCLDGMQIGDDQIFLLHISMDLFAVTIEKTEREAKQRFGRAAYLWTALRQWLGYQPCRFTLSIDGRPPRRIRAASVFITNIAAVGLHPLYWGPHIRPDDGKLDICIIKAHTVLDYLKIIRFALLGQQQRNPRIKYLTARCTVEVSTNRPLPVQADGEIIGQQSVAVKFVPQAIHLIVPSA